MFIGYFHIRYKDIESKLLPFLKKSGFTKFLTDDHFFMSIQEAVDYYESNGEEVNQFKEYVNQSND